MWGGRLWTIIAAARSGLRLALIAALQQLPVRHRTVLILRDVLGWRATEVTELLGASVIAVNSALQRARGQLQQTVPWPTRSASRLVTRTARYSTGMRLPSRTLT
jgi:DNA-directed RNA polymerase specialized sigma24 family protein